MFSEEPASSGRVSYSADIAHFNTNVQVPGPPVGWFWSHDIQADQIGALALPGYQMQRLTVYGSGNLRRFAAFLERGAAVRFYAIDLKVDQLQTEIRNTRSNAISLCVDASTAEPRFTAILEKNASPSSTVKADLNESELHKLINGPQSVEDLVTYSKNGGRKYAVILGKKDSPWLLFTDLSRNEVASNLDKSKARLTRIRAYSENGKTRYSGVAKPAGSMRWSWYTDLTADALAEKLEDDNGYLLDLDATSATNGLRFTAILAKLK
ncbi:MAG: hypothetical protein K8S54_21285 [Spirochaetia bacterium]|nr:hypothetical protein [Spirochaetia bacterium]